MEQRIYDDHLRLIGKGVDFLSVLIELFFDSFMTRVVEILGQSDPVGAKTPIFNSYSLI